MYMYTYIHIHIEICSHIFTCIYVYVERNRYASANLKPLSSGLETKKPVKARCCP